MKDYCGDAPPVERAVAVEDGTAERVDQRGQCGTTRRGDVVGHVVGVHDAESQVAKALRDRGLSRADAPSDDNSFHRSTVVRRCHTPTGPSGWSKGPSGVE